MLRLVRSWLVSWGVTEEEHLAVVCSPKTETGSLDQFLGGRSP